MPTYDDWRDRWWIRRFAPGVALVFVALFLTARGRQYAQGDALVMAGSGAAAVAAICVALYFGLPIFGHRLNEETQRFDPAPSQTIWSWLGSALLTLVCVVAVVVVLGFLLAGRS